MWPMIAEPGLRCSECRHTIQPGRLCLSELPEETPAGVSRADFRNYCVGCPECWSRGRHACYVRYLEEGASIGTVPDNLPCARCGRRIMAGDKAGIDTHYDWTEELAEQDDVHLSLTKIRPGVSAASSIETLVRGLPTSGSFTDLSNSLQQKFKYGGLRGGARSMSEAGATYRDVVPYPIRNMGEDAVWRFRAGKDFSHIKSFKNSPHLENARGNLMLEKSGRNRARGSADATQWQIFRNRGSNGFHASAIILRECFTAATFAARNAAARESPIAIVENVIHYRKGRKSGREAIRDASLSIAEQAKGAGTIAIAVTLAIAIVPGVKQGLILIMTFSPIFRQVGMALYCRDAVTRIMAALEDDPPLNRIGAYFCSPRCHTTFAYDAGRSALVRWESNRVASYESPPVSD